MIEKTFDDDEICLFGLTSATDRDKISQSQLVTGSIIPTFGPSHRTTYPCLYCDGHKTSCDKYLPVSKSEMMELRREEEKQI